MAEKVHVNIKITPEMDESFKRLMALTDRVKGTQTTKTYVIARTAALGISRYMTEELGMNIMDTAPEIKLKAKRRRKKAS